VTSTQTPAGWFTDPFGRHHHRYWDGVRWTEHIASGGVQGVDAPVPSPPPLLPVPAVIEDTRVVSAVERSRVNKSVQRQVGKFDVTDSPQAGGGTLFTERILVINQKAKLFERKAEYSVFDQQGRKVGAVRQFGTSMSRLAVGRDSATKRLQIMDGNGRPALTLTRPATVWKSKVVVSRDDGTPVGLIAQDTLGLLGEFLGGRFNIRFRMEANGEQVGTINAESWQAWDFSIQDAGGVEIARITKTWAGFSKEMFTKADNYVLEIHRPLEDPLLSLVVSAALVVDTVLKQDSDNQRSR
jgi:hypothetical protein